MEAESGHDGTFPDYGAIFMSSCITKQECLEKGLFGLPSSHMSFVKRVKAGMILFLFEYEDRKLHGVFEAASDGDFNIVPSAYASSGKLFSAQVRVRRIWHCDPLSEYEFRYAIRKNYFSHKKFNFGLSKRQVHKLLQLFHTRKVEVSNDLSSSKASQVEGQQSSPLDDKIEKGYSSTGELVMSQSMVGDTTVTPDHRGTNESDALQSQSVPCNGPAEDGNGSGSSPDHLGDFIPLPIHDKEDLEEGHDAKCWYYDYTKLPTYGFYGEGCFFEPNGSISISGCGSSEWINTDHHFLLMDPDKVRCLANLESSIVDGCCEEGANVDQMNNPKDKLEYNSKFRDNISDVAGLYSDSTCERRSVFSRLKLASEESVLDMVEFGAVASVSEIMKELKQRQKKWMKIVKEESNSETIDEENNIRRSCNMEQTKSTKQKRTYSTMARHSSGIRPGDCLPGKKHVSAADEGTDVRRSSVFHRLGELSNVLGNRLSESSFKRTSERKKTKTASALLSEILEREGIGNKSRKASATTHTSTANEELEDRWCC